MKNGILSNVLRLWPITAALAFLASSAAAFADEVRDRQNIFDELRLRQARVGLSEAGLLAFVREQGPAGDPRDVPHLIEKLRSDEFEEREKASTQLIKMGPMAVDALRRASTDKDPEVARRAQQCLERVEQRQQLVSVAVRVFVYRKSVESLRPLLRSKDSGVRRAAAEGLGEIGEKAAVAVPELISLLSDPQGEAINSARFALYNWGFANLRESMTLEETSV